MFPREIYYEPAALEYELGKQLKERYGQVPWIPIASHNNIEQLRTRPNSDFAKLKQLVIVGVRKTHKYSPNTKTSDFIVPYTSSGCGAMCLYCYLVCNYNKCSYLRLFVNREQMLSKLIKTAEQAEKELTLEIGSNSDLVYENTLTGNLEWTITHFAKARKGFITFPTKFDSVQPLLGLDHAGRTIMRMSVNPREIIRTVEIGTSPLANRISALNQMCDAGYKVGILIAPVVMVEGWEAQYAELLQELADTLSPKVKREMFVEIIFMTYSYVHRAINKEAFPTAVELYDSTLMTGRGRGKYWYKPSAREQGEAFLRAEFAKHFDPNKIVYIV